MKRYVVAIVVISLVSLAIVSLAFHTTERHKSVSHPKVKRNVTKNFEIRILGVKECGALCRTVKAELVNRDGDARNVTAILELFVGRDRIKVNGKNRLVIPIGDLKHNGSVVKVINVSVSFFDGLRIKSARYVVAKLTIIWDGGREVFIRKLKI